MDGIIPDGL